MDDKKKLKLYQKKLVKSLEESELEPFKNINLTFEIKTPVIPFYGEVGHITPLKNELHEPIFGNENFTTNGKVI